MKRCRWKIKVPSLWAVLYQNTLEKNTSATFEGIKITNLAYQPAHYKEFVQITSAALQLIQDYSPRHFQRIQCHVRFICYRHLIYGGQWDTATATCKIDFSQVHPWFTKEQITDASDYSWHLTYYAGVLIHEATHARLEALGFPYTKKTYRRIERLCEIEERRFWWAVYEFTDTQKQESLQQIDLAGYDNAFHLSLWERIEKAREIIKELKREESVQ